MYDTLEGNNRYKLYICLSETTNGKRDLVEGTIIFYFSENWLEREVIQIKTKITIRKNISKEMWMYILVSCVIDGETWLRDLVGLDVSYNSDIPFEQFDHGYTTECRIGTRFVTWCIVKLYFHISLCITFHILIVSNYISHLRIKVISWIWVVGDVTKTPYFSDLI